MSAVHRLVRAEVRSPLGALFCVAKGEALLGVYQDTQNPPPDVRTAALDSGHPVLVQLAAELDAYFAGESRRFAVPLSPAGTEFQRLVWRALVEIPYGETRTYGEVARAIGKPAAVRAVGAANGRNPMGIVIPCHRVIGIDGSLTGYAGGTENKRWLLEHERTNAPRA